MQLLLILPACLFMFALLVRQLQIPQYELAHTAQRIVMGYVHHPWTLWVLLIALPLSVLIIGSATLLRNGKALSRTADIFIAGMTLVALFILAVVAVHMLMN